MTIELEEAVAAALKTVSGVRGVLAPPKPRIVRIRHAIGVDAAGTPVVQIWVILGNETPADALRHVQFQPFADDVREAIRLAMRTYGVSLFQHVRFLLESEEPGFVPASAGTLHP